MTAKEYLQQYRDAVRRATAAQDHLDELRAIAERITPRYGGESGGTVHSGDRLGETVAKIIAAEDRLDAEISMLIATEREIEAAINNVDDSILRKLLYERYINGKNWESISVMLHYSYQHVTHFLHPKALVAVKKHLLESNIESVL